MSDKAYSDYSLVCRLDDFWVGWNKKLGKFQLFDKYQRLAECVDFTKTHKGEIAIWLRKIAKLQSERIINISSIRDELFYEQLDRTEILSAIEKSLGEKFGN